MPVLMDVFRKTSKKFNAAYKTQASASPSTCTCDSHVGAPTLIRAHDSSPFTRHAPSVFALTRA
jgi:hypothetical protein